MKLVFTTHPQLRVIYEENFMNDHERRRAFIVRSSKVPNGYAASWVRHELHAMSRKTHPDARHGTSADMNPVAPFTQEHPHGTSADMTPVCAALPSCEV